MYVIFLHDRRWQLLIVMSYEQNMEAVHAVWPRKDKCTDFLLSYEENQPVFSYHIMYDTADLYILNYFASYASIILVKLDF